ncbi:MAG: FMN-binding protein, partial [Bacteroidales bacterium]|nr:FMN-binding protein [Bacteroidales bacterium]
DQLIHGVDAISGGTITSNGVSEMIQSNMSIYLEYIKKQKI